MSRAAEQDVSLVTPSHRGDFDRFALQRESLERCGVDLPHHVFVNDEDVALFAAVPHRTNLHIHSTRDVLGPRFEARRRAWGKRRRDVRHWKGRPGIHGWGIQQLLKLAAPQVIDTEGFVCLDSDVFVVDRVDSSDFFGPDGRMHLYETTGDCDCEMGEWYIRSLQFLGEPVRRRPVLRTTHAPVPMHRGVVTSLWEHIERLSAEPWMDAITAGGVMEYATYGAFARYVDGLARVVPASPHPLCLYFWWQDEVERVVADLASGVRDTPCKMVLINSSHGLCPSDYRSVVEEAWRERGH